MTAFRIVHQKLNRMLKIDVYVIYTYTTTYIAASCLSFAVLLNKSFRFRTNSRNMLYLCRRKAASQQNIQASLTFCIRFAFPLQKKSGIAAF